MSKKKLFLDIDDTVLNTEKYIREVVGGTWADFDGLLYEEYESMSAEEYARVLQVISDYSKIPFIEGAEEGIMLLKMDYDLVFCSSYFLDIERDAKKVWADKLGIPVILCKGFTKCNVDMSGGYLIDDNTDNLDMVNADRKICFYKKYHCFNLDGKEIFYNWYDLVDELCGRR